VKWYISTLQRDFAQYGFIGCPLTEDQMTQLYKLNIKLDQAYGVGCDVAAGFSFEEALEALV
jgi:hypothetical protein